MRANFINDTYQSLTVMQNNNQSKRWRNLQTVCKFYQLFPTHFCIGDAHKVFYLLIHMLMIFFVVLSKA
ncbi:TPA: hypothetical protein I7704_03745 [Vibrio vulnificus]|nr:hypothetical protein [Vibrio vulnificus]HAS8363538.1 hypothetical protein [Vibrio vulnificus]